MENYINRNINIANLHGVGFPVKKHHFGLTKHRGRVSEGGTVRQDLGLIQMTTRGSTADRADRQTWSLLCLSMMSETEEDLLRFRYDLPS